MRRDTFLKSLAALAATGSFPLSALAAANVKMMIPANPGGGWDTTGRALGKALQEAKVEQLRQQPDTGVHDVGAVVRSVALELSPLIADKDLDFDITTEPAPVRSHEWMLSELVRNLLHNAIKHTPQGGLLWLRLVADERQAALTVFDSGPGIGDELRSRLFQPFSAGNIGGGSGLGRCQPEDDDPGQPGRRLGHHRPCDRQGADRVRRSLVGKLRQQGRRGRRDRSGPVRGWQQG